MNILVLSDSHGNISNMEEAVEREKPDMISIWGTAGGMRNGWRNGIRTFPWSTFPEIVTAVRRSRRKNCCF